MGVLLYGGGFLSGCGGEKNVSTSANETAPTWTEESALAAIRERMPAERHVSNDFLPPLDADLTQPPFAPLAEPVHLAVSMPWVLNDEEAPWYVAIERGYFSAFGLEIELIPGGPGIDALTLLVGGRAQIAVPAASTQLIRLLASRTSADLVAVSAKTKRSAYVWLMLDESTPRDQRSNRTISREDLLGRTVGIQAGYEWIWPFLANRWNLPEDAVRIRKVGFTPDPLVGGAVDFYAAWIVNQPRSLEAQGIQHWVALEFASLGLDDYMDVSVVTREMLETQPDLVRRYNWALAQAMDDILRDPQSAAEITVRWARDADLSVADVLRRFELERPLILEVDDLPPLRMRPALWDQIASVLLRYDQIELPPAR